MNVTDWLLKPEHADRPALITLQSTHTHAELRAASDGFAAWLLGAGARPGEFVAIVGDNSFFSLACWLGSMRAGCVAIPLAGSVAAETWQHIVSTTELRFACLQKLQSHLTTALGADAYVITETHLPRVAARDPWPRLDEAALAMLLFTSGSTGIPRGVMITHENLRANATGIWATS